MAWHLRDNEKVDTLGRLPLFAGLGRRELARIAEVVVDEERKAGTHLTHAGRDGGLAFVIVEGTADVVRDGVTLAKLGPGEVVGELSLLDGQPRTADVLAATDLRVLAISNTDFTAVLTRVPELSLHLLAVLAGRLRAADTVLADPR